MRSVGQDHDRQKLPSNASPANEESTLWSSIATTLWVSCWQHLQTGRTCPRTGSSKAERASGRSTLPTTAFSEDLDFTAEARVATEDVTAGIAAIAEIARPLGVDLAVAEAHIEVVDDAYGRESVQARVPYQGALRMGSRPAIQFHISADEEIALPPETRSLLRDYEDADMLEGRLRCYRLEEILAEKLRAVGGQRRFAVARDLYDIGQLVERGADVGTALAVLPAKARLKGVDLSLAYETLVGREAEFRVSWDRTLAYLVDGSAEFDSAWSAATELLARAGTR